MTWAAVLAVAVLAYALGARYLGRRLRDIRLYDEWLEQQHRVPDVADLDDAA